MGQVLLWVCLEEMTGKPIPMGYLYCAQSHQRQSVDISKDLRQAAIATITQVRRLLTTGVMPPAEYGAWCKGCSLYAHCLPQAIAKVRRYQEI